MSASERLRQARTVRRYLAQSMVRSCSWRESAHTEAPNAERCAWRGLYFAPRLGAIHRGGREGIYDPKVLLPPKPEVRSPDLPRVLESLLDAEPEPQLQSRENSPVPRRVPVPQPEARLVLDFAKTCMTYGVLCAHFLDWVKGDTRQGPLRLHNPMPVTHRKFYLGVATIWLPLRINYESMGFRYHLREAAKVPLDTVLPPFEPEIQELLRRSNEVYEWIQESIHEKMWIQQMHVMRAQRWLAAMDEFGRSRLEPRRVLGTQDPPDEMDDEVYSDPE
uniref:Uncharacterized protein n=1 Tax=Erythrolobus australicus TaxID=1077150 RepID=A0A7S1TJV2_9RHOD|mmetsp:Transcript_1985/g.5259  ORF Transcript_1985/g.5259 Transcript_1985/m.5259 type:complete len:277 (+) Transcript_1985:44-874(+)